MPREKITVIGAGNVGATCAQRILEQRLGDVVLLDINEGVARGKALDLMQSGPVMGYAERIVGTADYRDTADSDIVVVTSGAARKPGMSRDDLLKINFDIVTSVVRQAAAASPEAVFIVVTNPLDAMVHAALRVSGFPRQRVVGMGGILDTARFQSFLAEALGLSSLVVEAMVLGGHGDAMVPCISLARVSGAPVAELLPADQIQAIVERTRQGGAEIVKWLQHGSAFYAPAAATVRMLAAVVRDEKALLPCAAWLEGEYGLHAQVLGVPVVLGRGGVERVVELELGVDDQTALEASAVSVRKLTGTLETWLSARTPV